MLRGICHGADWMVVVNVVNSNQIINFRQIHQQSQLTIGFFSARIWDWHTLRMVMSL